LIGTIRREYLDHTLFWNNRDLERKLDASKIYYNQHRVHTSLDGTPPDQYSDISRSRLAKLDQFGCKNHCGGLFQTPICA